MRSCQVVWLVSDPVTERILRPPSGSFKEFGHTLPNNDRKGHCPAPVLEDRRFLPVTQARINDIQFTSPGLEGFFDLWRRS